MSGGFRYKKFIQMLLILVVIAAILGIGILMTMRRSGARIESVVVETHVSLDGQQLDKISFVLKEDTELDTRKLKASDFLLIGRSGNHRNTWNMRPAYIQAEGRKVILTFTGFPASYYDIASWRCLSFWNKILFSSDDVTEVHTEIADEFEKHSIYDADWNPTGDGFDYSLFVPEYAQEPLPLVLVLHGMSDWDILLTGREAVSWADPAFQERHPCYVLVPYFDGGTTIGRETVLTETMKKIRTMIADGQVDPKRVYLTGYSMGGYHGILLMTRYSEAPVFAAALLLSPWLDPSLTEAEILRAATVPILLVYGERDPYIPDPGQLYDYLYGVSEEIEEVILPAAEFSIRKLESQHMVDSIVYENENYMEWVFGHSRK